MNIYFICTGNTCRSPMAEAILRSKALDGVTVRSAGIHAGDGFPIAQNAKQLIEESSMPYTPVSSSVSREDLVWADVILTMTEAHKEALLFSFPEVKHKTFTLKGYVQSTDGRDVLDPFGGDLDTYRRTFNELSNIMDELVQKMAGDQS
ncbi:low molecular weight protein arginine phosphatase [Sporosarcina sp. HYO08]|uniref:low molecular weight protein arginine phosphatase n=1 Tax=Sporosarcina sp. HYO08 TaxID=1759557 RepID=UPI00079A3A2A|nr:low molecular weight protein arginine phosphatase [Sporosarcina sp. HYO08]KXH83974.1 hypothetical protein AU377_04260 [Sporosarcina sp. HYO08]